jgi:calcium-dependent protein kinase
MMNLHKANEIAILKKFDSPHVVRFHDLITNKTTVYIVTEFCQDGDLRDYMRAKRLSEVEVIGIAV